MKIINRFRIVLLLFVFACVTSSSFGLSATGHKYIKSSKKIRSKAIHRLLKRSETRLREARAYGIKLPSEKLVAGRSILKQLTKQFGIEKTKEQKVVVKSVKTNAVVVKAKPTQRKRTYVKRISKNKRQNNKRKVVVKRKKSGAVVKQNIYHGNDNQKNDSCVKPIIAKKDSCVGDNETTVYTNYTKIKINKRVGTRLGLLIARMQNRAAVRAKEAQKYGLKFPVISRKQIHDGSYRKIIKKYCSNVNVG